MGIKSRSFSAEKITGGTSLLKRLNKEKYLQIMALAGLLWMLVFNYMLMYGILVAFNGTISRGSKPLRDTRSFRPNRANC